MQENFFKYSQKEMDYLKSKDKILGEIIDKIGKINRPTRPDLFSALVHAIVGQQISIIAQENIWQRLVGKVGEVNVENILSLKDEELQSVGLSFRKVEYIKGIAKKIKDGKLDMNGLHELSDDEVCEELSSLKGIGVWTAEMLMLFSMQRQNILSYGDLAIQRGLRMIYHHRDITPKLYAKYKRRFSPYGSVASLYIWAVAGGAIEGMRDFAPKTKEKKP